MKKYIILLCGIMFFAFNLNAQNIIWEENFDDPSLQGKGAQGPGNIINMTGVTKWNIDVTYANMSAIDDWFMVNSSLFESRDVDGLRTSAWWTETINLTGYTNTYFTIDLAEVGDHEIYDTCLVLYSVDGGAFQTSTLLIDDWTSSVVNQPVTGNNLVIKIKILNNAAAEYIRIDNVKVWGSVPGGVDNPSNFAAITISTSQINLSWLENSSGNNVLIAWNTTNTFGTPVNGTSYPAGSTIPGGGTSLGTDGDEAYSHTGLTPSTIYYYKIWSVNGTNQYSTGVTDEAATYMVVPTLYINEFMATNFSTIQDENGQFEDWIEIYNPGPAAVDLNGLYVTDLLSNPAAYQLPAYNLPAGGYVLLWCDNDGAGLHTNFALNGAGEQLGLFGSDGYTPIDTYIFGPQTGDVSEARQNDGGTPWVFFEIPTPNATNNTQYLHLITPDGGESWQQGSTYNIGWYSQNYTGDVKLELTGSNPSVIIASTPNSSPYSWTIPLTQPIASDYKVKISATGTGNPFDESDGTFTIVAEGTFPEPGDVIITEIMQNPSAVLDNMGEWFEVFNTTNEPIDLQGWIIKDADIDIDTIQTSLIVPPQGFVTLGNNTDDLTNGGYFCDYQYSASYFLGNADDEVILIGPDGATVIDSVAYDGGPNWPDPTGASMVYTGPANGNNNTSANWITATLREPNYAGMAGDLGSPGTEGQDQNLINIITGISLDLKVYLEGAYNTTGNNMNLTLNSTGNVPIVQPYNPVLPYYQNNNPAWLYSGTESVTSVPVDAVDWVLVELRDAVDGISATGATMIARQACFVNQNGQIRDITNAVPFFAVTPVQGLFAVIWHRNHLAVMNSNPLTDTGGGNYVYDFSTGAAQAYGGSVGYKQIDLSPEVWGMIAADGNADRNINTQDKLNVWKLDVGSSGYFGGDFNLDGQVNTQDKLNVWKPNSGKSSQVPN